MRAARLRVLVRQVPAVFVLLLAAVAARGADGAPPGAGGGPSWEQLRRPLHLPKLRPGDRCPTSAVRPYGAGSDDLLVGPGPVYLLVGSLATAVGAVGYDIGLSWRDSKGWRGTKTPWEIDSSYGGRVLVRGARIDRPGGVRFGSPPTPAGPDGRRARELHWGAGVDHDSGRRYRGLATGTLFRAAGCYAFQADGTSFSEVVVVAVTDRRRRR